MTVIDWRKEVHDAAMKEVERFIQCNPEFSIRNDMKHLIDKQLAGWGVNFVIWGYCRERPVVFKCYYPKYQGRERWNNEYACLKHFSDTGYTPEVFATVPERIIVMSCLPGWTVLEEVENGGLSSNELANLGKELGIAIGRLANTPLPKPTAGYSIVRDYNMMPWQEDLNEAINFYLRLCRRDQNLFEASSDPFYDASLYFVESQAHHIKHQERMIFLEDLQCFAHKGRVQGFYDFELSRLGTDLIQLGRVFRWCSPDGLQWSDFLEGYSSETGRYISDKDYEFMLAMNLFHSHIRITRWGKPDSKSDYVAEHLPIMKKETMRFVDHVDLDAIFPNGIYKPV